MHLLDHELISSRYFFPRSDPPPEVFEVQSGDVRLACHRAIHDPDAPTLVYFHGNGEVVADYVPGHCQLFAALGWNTFLVEYRGYGGSSGAPALLGMLADVEACFEALGVPEERLIAFGRSVGSIYAIELACKHPQLAGLILESGIADPLQRVLLRVTPEELDTSLEALEAEAAEHLDHQAKLGGYTGPLLVLHARHDGLVTLDHAERNHFWAGGREKRLIVFPRGDHNTILFENQLAYVEALREFSAVCRA